MDRSHLLAQPAVRFLVLAAAGFSLPLWSLLSGALSPREGLRAQEQPPQPGASLPPAGSKDSSSLPPGVLARVDGKDITIEIYSQYLLARIGKTRLQELIDKVLVEDESVRLGVAITPDIVEKEVADRIDRNVRGLYKGEVARLEDNLKKRGLSFDDYKQMLRQEVAYDLLRDACILRTRSLTDEDIRRQFENVYGEDGVRYELRHILITARAPGRLNDPAGNPLPSEQEAREKAERTLKELRDGADFIQMVKTYSEDPLTKRNDGRIPIYRRNYFGEEFHQAVLGLSETNRLSGVVRSPRGFHIIHLIRKETTRLEDKRQEVTDYLKTQQPTAREVQDFIQALRDKAKVVF